MIPLPNDLVLKVENAELAVTRLAEEYEAYVGSEPVTLVPEYRYDQSGSGGSWGARTMVNQQPPGRLTILAGDAVQAIRSSLDYLANALVISNGGVPELGPGGTAFPIRTKKGAKPLTIAGGVDPSALDLIEFFQPYQSDEPERRTLAALAALSNIDKHRALLTAVTSFGVPGVYAIIDGSRHPHVGLVLPSLRMHVHEEWAIDPIFRPPPPDGNVFVETEGLAAQVSLGDAKTYLPISVVQLVDHFLRFVRDLVIPTFKGHFEPPWPDEIFALNHPGSVYDQLRRDVLTSLRGGDIDKINALLARHPGLPGEDPRMLIIGLCEGLSLDPRFTDQFLDGTWPIDL